MLFCYDGCIMKCFLSVSKWCLDNRDLLWYKFWNFLIVICDVVRNLYFNLKLLIGLFDLIKNLMDFVELIEGILILYLGFGRFGLEDG